MSSKKLDNTELLVALLPKIAALKRLQSAGWYHIPVDTSPKRWPPTMMAFFQGKVFGAEEAYRIRYFGEVERIDTVPRKELFRTTKRNAFKAERLYYRIQIKNLTLRNQPIVSHRPRRMVFIPTTLKKFEHAEQINDLFDGSPLEDKLWSELKSLNIHAERQYKIITQGHNYYLDFAVFCKKGKLAIETDGYTTHHDSLNQIDYDTWRQNEIELDGWRLLHYTTRQVNDNWSPYLAQIQTAINQLGGIEAPEKYGRKVGEQRGRYIVDGEDPL